MTCEGAQSYGQALALRPCGFLAVCQSPLHLPSLPLGLTRVMFHFCRLLRSPNGPSSSGSSCSSCRSPFPSLSLSSLDGGSGGFSSHLWHDEGGKATYPFSLYGVFNTTPVYRWKILYNATLFASVGILVRSSSPISLCVLVDEFVSSLLTDPVHLLNGRVQRRRFKSSHRNARSLLAHL